MYIDRICSISPAGVFTGAGQLLQPEIVNGRMSCTEPDYNGLIPPMQLRRMSKPVRTGVAAAKLCLDDFKDLAAINIGTAYGMLQDSESFLDKMIRQEEDMLNPTAFIQSTHNTVGGQVALSLQCNAHNMTCVHKGHSFESALLDAELLLKDHEGSSVLAGAVDECTDTSFAILSELGVYNKNIIAGEGAHFYLLSGKCSTASLAKIAAFEMFTADNITSAVAASRSFMERGAFLPAEGEVLLYGANGSGTSEENYACLRNELFSGIAAMPFKEYSGEYPTASGFAPAFAVSLLAKHTAAWIVNNYGRYWSIYYIKKV